jgi:hypothetical protein
MHRPDKGGVGLKEKPHIVCRWRFEYTTRLRDCKVLTSGEAEFCRNVEKVIDDVLKEDSLKQIEKKKSLFARMFRRANFPR